MVILRGWAGAPLSPRVQGRPSARATTLKAKSPRALLWRADLTSLTRARKGPNHQTAQTLLSAQATGPQQVALLTSPPLGHPTPNLAQKPGP